MHTLFLIIAAIDNSLPVESSYLNGVVVRYNKIAVFWLRNTSQTVGSSFRVISSSTHSSRVIWIRPAAALSLAFVRVFFRG